MLIGAAVAVGLLTAEGIAQLTNHIGGSPARFALHRGSSTQPAGHTAAPGAVWFAARHPSLGLSRPSRPERRAAHNHKAVTRHRGHPSATVAAARAPVSTGQTETYAQVTDTYTVAADTNTGAGSEQSQGSSINPTTSDEQSSNEQSSGSSGNSTSSGEQSSSPPQSSSNTGSQAQTYAPAPAGNGGGAPPP